VDANYLVMVYMSVAPMFVRVVGRLGHRHFGHSHASLDVLAMENIQGERFGYIFFL